MCLLARLPGLVRRDAGGEVVEDGRAHEEGAEVGGFNPGGGQGCVHCEVTELCAIGQSLLWTSSQATHILRRNYLGASADVGTSLEDR